MNALTIFIRRPVLATMVTVLLLVLGLFSYKALGVDMMPKVEFPMVTVTTVLRGASPEEIESQVSKIVEQAVNTCAGIDELYSYSFEGVSRVVIRFVLERPVAEAVQDVRDKVATVLRYLPDDIEPPVVQRIDFDAIPVITLTLSGPRDMKEISEIARLKVKEAIENVNGVGAVFPVGNWVRAINVVLDLDKLQAYGIPIAAVKAAVATQNVEIPSGRIDRGDREQVLRTLARVERLEDFTKLVVANRGGHQITLGDIGRVEDSTEEPRSLARIWRAGDKGRGNTTVALTVQKQSGTNTVEVIESVKKRIAQIVPTLPPGFRIDTVSDQSVFIIKSIDELQFHLILGGLLAALAVLLFMRNVRSTIIAAVAIPTSLIATFTLMRALNFTLNNMSLLGLTLAVGIVIDDAIVVLENIFRHMEELGKPPLEAAIDGLKEIGLAVMATTTSLMVIFLPVAFMQGMVGRFFFEFGLTVAFAIGISLVISLTLTPMLSSRFLRMKAHGGASKENRFWELIDRGYGALLGWSLAHRALTVLAAILIVATTVPIAGALGKDFIPSDDRSEFAVSITAPAGVSLSAVSEIFGKVEDDIHKVRGVSLTLTQLGNTGSGTEDVTQGSIYVHTVDLDQRNYSQFDVMRDVRAVLANYPELRSSVNEFGGLSGTRGGYQFQYNLTGPDLDRLTEFSDQVARKMRATPGFIDVDTSLASRQPEIRVRLDRPKAGDLGISAADVALTLRTMVGGEKVSKFRDGVEQYDVWLRLERKDRDDAGVINRLPIASAKAGMVPLSQVADLSEGKGPSEIDRFNRQRLVSLYANLDGLDLGRANVAAAKMVKDLTMPPEYGSPVTGRSRMMGEAMSLLITLLIVPVAYSLFEGAKKRLGVGDKPATPAGA